MLDFSLLFPCAGDKTPRIGAFRQSGKIRDAGAPEAAGPGRLSEERL